MYVKYIGTPGRVLDLLKKKFMNVDNAKTLVLDEADKLLSIDFYPITEMIVKHFPKNR